MKLSLHSLSIVNFLRMPDCEVLHETNVVADARKRYKAAIPIQIYPGFITVSKFI